MAPVSLVELESKKSISDLANTEIKGKQIRIHYDVNFYHDGKIFTDSTRIRSSIPTIEYIKGKGAIVTVFFKLDRLT